MEIADPKKQSKDTDPVKIRVHGNLLAMEGAADAATRVADKIASYASTKRRDKPLARSGHPLAETNTPIDLAMKRRLAIQNAVGRRLSLRLQAARRYR
ncbi:hypothetical protein [Caballeronia sp. NK8]|uniref:hypothetical protein n=1 Tax=Caballeronia sp. NK8 TaxID=140098 RepID=UPI001BCFADA9|nr:hypothetical protein [Caballeronia sp. NK8]